MKKIPKSLLTVAIIICVSLNVCQVDAKSKKITLWVGDTKQVSFLKANRKYKCSNKSVAKINSKGKIVALKKGKTRIYCKDKKVCDVTVKNSYFVGDFTNVEKMVIVNLKSGETKEFGKKDIALLQQKMNENKFYRIAKNVKKKKGGFDYSILFYDKNEKELFKIALGKKKMKYYPSPEQTYDFVSYSSKIAIDISEFK